MSRGHVLTDGFIPSSAMTGVSFPALVEPRRATALAVLAQLAETQWWSPDRMREHQLRQLGLVLRHAARTTAYGREVFPDLADAPLTWERFQRLPLLTRRAVQARRDALVSDAVPKEHGPDFPPAQTSGSTGTPVVVARTRLTDLIWTVLTAREHLWFGRDTSLPMAVVRLAPSAAWPEGRRFDAWGPSAALIGPPGPCHLLDISATTEQQLAWLQQREFATLLHYPSGIRDLIRAARREGVRFPGLQAVRTFGEVVTPELREEVHEAWGVPVHDLYSTQELGYVALQCPDHEHYHVQSESLYVEVLREDGTPCAPGEVGRIVATALHNFAMPLIRYDFGDLGVLGPPCPCGRGLPVLQRILGRVHQTFVTRSGDRIWLTVGVHLLRSLGPVAQHQLVQPAVDHLVVRLVPERPPTADETEAIRAHVAGKLPPGTRVDVTWVDEIPRTASGKFLDYVSQLDRGDDA